MIQIIKEEIIMNYKNILKGYGVSTQPTTVAVETFQRSRDDVDQILRYFDHLETNYFEDIPYSRHLPKSLIWNIPTDVFNYMTKLMLMDVPITCNPMTMLYGMCLEDEEMYPDFVKRLIEYDVSNEDDVVEYINKNMQLNNEPTEPEGDDT